MKTFQIQYQIPEDAPETMTVRAESEEKAIEAVREKVSEQLGYDLDNHEVADVMNDFVVLECQLIPEPKGKNEWLIWSEEHRAWWKPQWSGYTKERADAGRYTFEEACGIVKSANIHQKDVPNEAMVRYEV